MGGHGQEAQLHKGPTRGINVKLQLLSKRKVSGPRSAGLYGRSLVDLPSRRSQSGLRIRRWSRNRPVFNASSPPAGRRIARYSHAIWETQALERAPINRMRWSSELHQGAAPLIPRSSLSQVSLNSCQGKERKGPRMFSQVSQAVPVRLPALGSFPHHCVAGVIVKTVTLWEFSGLSKTGKGGGGGESGGEAISTGIWPLAERSPPRPTERASLTPRLVTRELLKNPSGTNSAGGGSRQ